MQYTHTSGKEAKQPNYKTVFCKFYAQGKCHQIQDSASQEMGALTLIKDAKRERKKHLNSIKCQ